MTRKKPFVPRQFTAAQWAWFLVFIGLVTHLPLLKLATAETTDGVWSMTYFSKDFFPNDRFVIFPGYPALIWIGMKIGAPAWLWGRSLSFLFSMLLLIPLWKLGRRWLSLEMTGVICVMALLSPLLWFWSLKVMPDVLFVLAFWTCLERLVTTHCDRDEKAWWVAVAAGALSACVRPEGFLLLPWTLLLGDRVLTGNVWLRRAGALVVWAGPLLILKPMLFTILDAYREGLGLHSSVGADQIGFLNVVDHFYAYLSQPVLVFTPLVYWFAILGLGKMTRRTDREGQAFRKVLLQVLTLLFLSRLFPSAYQDRYLLPFLPLILLAAGVHLENFFEHWKSDEKPVQNLFWKNGVLTLCFAWMTLYSAASLISQSDSFGDIRRSSDFLKTLPAGITLYSDEVPKTAYWSGRTVVRMAYLTENTPFNPKPGDYVVLHSCYTPRLGFVDQNMRDRFGAALLHQESSMVVPLLTDLMEDQKLQNRVGATAFRFQPQFFTSLVYRIDGPPKKAKR